MLRKLISTMVLLASAVPSALAAAPAVSAIVIQDRTALRAEPRDSAQRQAVLWRGEVVEVRGERMDYLQVYDYKRERGGFVRASQMHRTRLTAAEAPELLTLIRFVRDTAGAEALGIGFVAAYIQAAPSKALNSDSGIEALDALGTMADRLAHRSSSGTARDKAIQSTLSAHLEVASGYGVRFANYEHGGRMHICYEGDAFRRVLAMRSSAEQRARAILALTRQECVDADLGPLARKQVDEWRADVLDRVEASGLPAYLKNRVLMRRAAVWSSLAYQRARLSEPADAAATRALSEIAAINKTEITENDAATYNDAAMRVSASRWAAVPASAARFGSKKLVTTPGRPGETCIALFDEKSDAASPLAQRCTYGLVWAASATLNREGNALALAVQPTDTWRELWVFRKERGGWTIRVLPPTNANPEVGYAEFAGWAPGGKYMLAAREARSEGRYRRSFELINLATLAIERRASNPSILGAFQRWQSASWRRQTLSIR